MGDAMAVRGDSYDHERFRGQQEREAAREQAQREQEVLKEAKEQHLRSGRTKPPCSPNTLPESAPPSTSYPSVPRGAGSPAGCRRRVGGEARRRLGSVAPALGSCAENPSGLALR